MGEFINNYKVRKLKASELEVKPCQVAKDKSWVQVLIYKTSRVDMQVLTEMYGSKWKSDYRMVGDSLFCTISVYDSELNEWISRTDCGEKDAGICEEKSYATSAFKRAATQFGIGIELYSTPKIKFPTKQNWFYNDKLSMTFEVSEIEWDGDTLVKLTIVDRWGNVVYSYPTTETQTEYIQQEVQQMNYTTTEQKDHNALIPKGLWFKVTNTQSIENLKDIWNDNPQYQENVNFKRLVNNKKAALAAAS